MRCRHFCIFVNGAWQSALGCSLMRYRLFFNPLYEQPRALCHAPLANIQKCLQRIFATLYFVRSFFILGPWHFGDFCKIFLPNIEKTKQKSYDFRAGPPSGTAPYYGKSPAWLMHYVHKTAMWGSEIATFRIKTLHFFRVIRLNWLAKIELKGARGPWSSILLLVTVTSKKKTKRNWNWRNSRLFWHISVIGEISIGGFPSSPFFGYAYTPIEENKKGICKFSARVLAFSNKISTIQKIVLSSSRGQGNFRGLQASRPRPRTSKCVLEDVLEAKVVIEDSTSGKFTLTITKITVKG